MDYAAANQAKACFDNVYTAPTPHAYVAKMAQNNYEIGEQARPYCIAATELLSEQNGPECPVQMLDVGCSYGVGAALVKYGRHFDEMIDFFRYSAPREYRAALAATREWLHDQDPAQLDEKMVRCIGLDSSAPAIQFATDAGMLDGGLALDLENPQVQPNSAQRQILRHTNLMISTGAIGYITDRTVGTVVGELGKEAEGEFGPVAVMTILRMFDDAPIQAAFEQNGMKFDRVPGVMLPQRDFADDEERDGVLTVLHEKGVDTSEWEDRGKHYAELYIAAPEPAFPDVLERMLVTHAAREEDETLQPLCGASS